MTRRSTRPQACRAWSATGFGWPSACGLAARGPRSPWCGRPPATSTSRPGTARCNRCPWPGPARGSARRASLPRASGAAPYWRALCRRAMPRRLRPWRRRPCSPGTATVGRSGRSPSSSSIQASRPWALPSGPPRSHWRPASASGPSPGRGCTSARRPQPTQWPPSTLGGGPTASCSTTCTSPAVRRRMRRRMRSVSAGATPRTKATWSRAMSFSRRRPLLRTLRGNATRRRSARASRSTATRQSPTNS
mmetsp:Transcript_53837/g.166682  ORF Transcript_53837/g.166682 Transcript_53837/m.166682 type:complete len:249 (-) Transcript_53837:496-1242(-)